MDKMKMQTPDLADEKFQKLAALFPNAVTETIDENGEVVRSIDADVLRQEVDVPVVDGQQERYQFTWPGKRDVARQAAKSISKALRPCREESVDFDKTENLYIEGDNLDVLKLLRETYLGEVKMIYIDPPYNTGNDFIYKDDLFVENNEFLLEDGQKDEIGNRLVQNTESNGRFHTDWLNMLYPRLKLAKDLLHEDGVIFISIDEMELENLLKICNEIFGELNYAGTWFWYKSATPPNLSHKIKRNIEYIVAYEKKKNSSFFRGIQKTSKSDDPFTKPQNSMKQLCFPKGSIHFKNEEGILPHGTYGTDKFPNLLLNDIYISKGTNTNDATFENRFIWTQEKLLEELNRGTVVNC